MASMQNQQQELNPYASPPKSAQQSPPKSAQQYFPINEISSYQQRWTICARVTSRTQLRTFTKGSGGKVFSVDLLDGHDGEIRASFFNDAADQFFDKMQVGKCFTLARGSVKVANRQFNNCKHRYELTFDKMADIKEVADAKEIQAIHLSITSLQSVKEKTLPCNADLCGILTNFGPAVPFTSQAGKNFVKREIVIVDDSTVSLSITLWGERAQQEDKVFEGNPVVALKGVMIKEWQQGRSGSLGESATMMLRPTNIPEAEKVQLWWSQGGSKQSVTSLSAVGGSGERRAISGKPVDLAGLRVASASLGADIEHFTVVCRLAMVQTQKQGERHPIVYMACQEPKEGNGFPCNRRVDSAGFCGACNRAGKAAPRFNARCRFSDFADSAWLTTFHEGAQRIFQMTASECHQLDQGDEAVREAALKNHYFAKPMQVTVRAKMEAYNNELRTNLSCVDARPVSRAERGRAMLAEITQMLALRT